MLLKDLKNDIESTLMDEVFDEVREIELRHIEQDVFSVYSPKIYQRRAVGGIDDRDQIVGTVNNMELEIVNNVEFNDDYGSSNHGRGLADLINQGERIGGYFYDYLGEFTQPRPFLDNTEEEIERTVNIENALAKGLKRREYDIT